MDKKKLRIKKQLDRLYEKKTKENDPRKVFKLFNKIEKKMQKLKSLS